MYTKQFEVRWSDMDANRHLANSAYVNFMSHTRMSYLFSKGITQKMMLDHQLGPIVFYEHIYYFREIHPGRPITVTLDFKGLSEDGMLFEFHHDFYDYKGRNLAHCEMMGGWINSETRKLTPLTKEALEVFGVLEKADDFRTLTKADTRKFDTRPIDIDPEVLKE